ATGRDFFFTNALFAPVGADLTLHNHTALFAFLGATVLKPFGIVTALNLTTLTSLTLNGVCTYWLAWRLTKDWRASGLAGTMFALSPYIAAHLNGHFDLVAAWPLPLFAIVVDDVVNGGRLSAVAAGLILVLTAYVDYYYVVYELALWCSVLAASAWM